MTDVAVDSRWLSVGRSGSSAEFFVAAERGVLVLRRCTECGHRRIARRDVCRACGGRTFDWVDACGRGTLVAWGVNPAAPDGGVVRPFGLVELDEGPWLESALDVDPAALLVGLELELVIVRGAEGDPYPAFRPVTRG
ncbi:OB-fold domain-containing protein [Rhodococcus olei]|uniref:OB-fold domain-containing protein n=1 Tax=Rhodococcus olei TaxID=2161675 RepID=A0ABP8NZD1_9NOCA